MTSASIAFFRGLVEILPWCGVLIRGVNSDYQQIYEIGGQQTLTSCNCSHLSERKEAGSWKITMDFYFSLPEGKENQSSTRGYRESLVVPSWRFQNQQKNNCYFKILILPSPFTWSNSELVLRVKNCLWCRQIQIKNCPSKYLNNTCAVPKFTASYSVQTLALQSVRFLIWSFEIFALVIV